MNEPFGTITAPQDNANREACGRCGQVMPTIVRLIRPNTDNQTGESYTSGDPFCSPACASAWWAAYTAPGAFDPD